jgi:hypothetical protein
MGIVRLRQVFLARNDGCEEIADSDVVRVLGFNRVNDFWVKTPGDLLKWGEPF